MVRKDWHSNFGIRNSKKMKYELIITSSTNFVNRIKDLKSHQVSVQSFLNKITKNDEFLIQKTTTNIIFDDNEIIIITDFYYQESETRKVLFEKF